MPFAEGTADRRRPAVPPGPYLVAGLGLAGGSAVDALTQRTSPDEVRVWDGFARAQEQRRSAELAVRGITVHHGDEGLERLFDAPSPRTLIKSPGLRPDAPVVVEAVQRGLTVIDEAELGWRLDARPLIAVTGTNGKSTTVSVLAEILRTAGRDPVVAGNTTFGIPYSTTTTRRGDSVLAELSSFQLEGCPTLLPTAAVLTNLTHDHHYRHGTGAAYEACKRRLFVRDDRAVAVAAIGIDQPFGRRLAGELRARGSTVVTFGIHPDADRRVLSAAASLDGGSVRVREGAGIRTLRTRLTGAHNALNLAGCLALADGLGLDVETAAQALGSVSPLPGRFERVPGPSGFDVVIDFAHNPDGVAQALGAGRAMLAARGGGRLLTVVSTLSMVDRQQAFDVGRVAASESDRVVLTTQRWTLEDPADRLPDGFEEGARSIPDAVVDVAYDRGEAIARALRLAKPGDAVLILDRGDRGGALYGGDDQPRAFDDRAYVRELLVPGETCASS